MIKRILSSKTRLGIAIIIILMLVMGLSYGTFLIGTDNYKVSELLIAELNYGIKIEEDSGQGCTVSETKVTTPQDTECFITIQISSVNPIDSRYALAYKNEQGNARVQYTDKTQWKSEGVIEDYNSNYTRKVRVVINNNGKTDTSITDFKVFGGYKFNSEVPIDLKNGYQTIPGTYTESIEAGNKRLVDIIEKDTNCITSDSKECLYGGGVITNYLQYPTSDNTSDNLWRITGSYELDGTTYAKVVYNTIQATTASTNIKSTLDSFYNTLEKASEIIQDTDKFNCLKEGCTESEYKKIGLLSTYEYEKAGGYESYLGNDSSWFALDNETVKNITPSNIEDATGNSGIRPTAYLQTDVTVTGKGTIEDPYRISPKGDINLVAYTLDGQPTKETYETLLKTKYVNKVTCDKGTNAEWDFSTNTIKLSNVHVPETCIIDFGEKIRFLNKILSDNEIKGTREDFSKPFDKLKLSSGLYVEKNSGYLEPEGKTEDAVYYFAGNPENNWVKFGTDTSGNELWWRIIRTNEDGSVRLLYAGTGHDKQDGKIGSSSYNNDYDNTRYVGYMYGEEGTLAKNRVNGISSKIKQTIDTWYDNNLKENFSSYLSKTAVYCSDRSTYKYNSTGDMYYGASMRLTVKPNIINYGGVTTRNQNHPSYKCGGSNIGSLWDNGGDIADKFTGKNNSSIGNQQLEDKPIALMTADEIVYAGGCWNNVSPDTYYQKNSIGGTATTGTNWWTMSPDSSGSGCSSRNCIFLVVNHTYYGELNQNWVNDTNDVRPVLSIKSCATVTGSGTTSDPYIPTVDAVCAAADN